MELLLDFIVALRDRVMTAFKVALVLPLLLLALPHHANRVSPTESSLESSPSAAMYDLDELELESPEIETETFASVPSPSQQQLDSRIRRDSAVSIARVAPMQAKSVSDMLEDETHLIEDPATLQKMENEGRPTYRLCQDAQSSRRLHNRTSSDPGEATPLVIERTRPGNALSRPATTGDLTTIRISRTESNTSSTIAHKSTSAYNELDAIDHDLSRHEVTLHAVNHGRSPLDRLVEDTEDLNLYDDGRSMRQPSSEILRFPSFEDAHSRSISLIETVGSHDLGDDAEPFGFASQSGARNLPELAVTSPARYLRDMPSTSSPVEGTPSTPTGRERLRAFAASFAPGRLFGRSPTAAQEDVRLSLESQTDRRHSPHWTLATSPPQLLRMLPLRDFAIVSGGRPLSASPMSPGPSATMSRSRAGGERENEDDTSQLEEEARFWRERATIANNREGNAGWEGRTPPIQARFLRFLDNRR